MPCDLSLSVKDVCDVFESQTLKAALTFALQAFDDNRIPNVNTSHVDVSPNHAAVRTCGRVFEATEYCRRGHRGMCETQPQAPDRRQSWLIELGSLRLRRCSWRLSHASANQPQRRMPFVPARPFSSHREGLE